MPHHRPPLTLRNLSGLQVEGPGYFYFVDRLFIRGPAICPHPETASWDQNKLHAHGVGNNVHLGSLSLYANEKHKDN
jgi:hypothetical protein